VKTLPENCIFLWGQSRGEGEGVDAFIETMKASKFFVALDHLGREKGVLTYF
jgi:hypothetical protein